MVILGSFALEQFVTPVNRDAVILAHRITEVYTTENIDNPVIDTIRLFAHKALDLCNNNRLFFDY